MSTNLPVGTVQKSAVFSEDRLYRYTLQRTWNSHIPPALFVGLNPSTADEEIDDPTIRRCIRFASDWGYGGLLMGNLFAFRATNPTDLPCIGSASALSPVGEYTPWIRGQRENVNDAHLKQMAKVAGITVAAWGATRMPVGWRMRPAQVMDLLQSLHCIGLTKGGHPRHPLYVKADTRPVPLVNHVHKWGPWIMYEASQERQSCRTCGAREWD